MTDHDRIDRLVVALRSGVITAREFEDEVTLILIGRR